jgi:DNA-binding protein H-NS
MAKIDLDALNIDELASLRERVTEKLAEKVAARQVELEAEMERLSQFGKPAKKSQGAPAAKAKKSDEKKNDGAREPKAPIADTDAAEAA